MTGMLMLARHGQSECNRENIFTSSADPSLTDQGVIEAKFIADQIRQMRIEPDIAFTSNRRRTRNTAEIVINRLGSSVPIVSNSALNERDYGDLTGMNKDQIACEFGAATVLAWRRSYIMRPPGGESLSDTRYRVVAYANREIKPLLRNGLNVLVIGHGNSLRALSMELEDMSPQQVETFEIATGQLIVYKVVLSKLGLRAVVSAARLAMDNSTRI